MDDLRRRLSINLAALAVLGSLLLGMGQQDYRLPLLTLLVAIVSLQVTDLRGLFHLNRSVANLAALVAVGLSAFDFTRLRREDQLLAIANLLVYLQVVVFFQKKTPRIHWQLAMLSLLQVVVAAALNYSILFGVLLVGYMCLGIYAMAQIFVYRETLAFEGRQTANNSRSEEDADSTITRNNLRDRLASLASARGLVRITAKVGLTTLLITLVIFFTIPRFGKSAFRGLGQTQQRMVGYSQRVELGELGQIVESPETVLQLRLFENDSQESFRLSGEPFLRGSILTTYQSTKSAGATGPSQWSPSLLNTGRSTRRLPVSRPAGGFVRQQISLEPLDETVVFGIYPIFGLGEENFVRYDGERSQLVRWPQQLSQTRLTVELGTSGIKQRRQSPVVPDYRAMIPSLWRELLQLPAPGEDGDPLEQLKLLADSVVAQSRVPTDDPYLVAQALEAHLRGGDNFSYSLQGADRDPTIDPLEDFVTNNPTGHCEYFASALVMMLRSQGIPARLIIGFKGGQWNELGGYYQFRQLHAHTWVEAYLTREQLTDRKVDLGEAPGGWLRLDPTAFTMEEDAGGVLSTLGQMLDYAETLWMRNVVGLDHQQQERRVYAPLRDGASGIFAGLTAPRVWMAWLGDQVEAIKQALGGRWLSWRGSLFFLALAATAYGLFYLLRIGWRRFSRRTRRVSRNSAQAQVEFYLRFERALQRVGIRRQPGQTQREFVASIESQPASPDRRWDEVAVFAIPLIEFFYRVRFGGHALDRAEHDEVEQALQKIEAALSH